MIQKGIIAQVIDKYTYKIRIPKYDKIEAATASTKMDDLSQGIVCAMPGVDVSYVLGDIVLVSFENDELSKPIILGLLYREQKTDSDISLTNVDNSLSDIQNNLHKINSSGLYTHIRYSNDNGLTFTSLFSDSNHETIIDGEVVCQPLYDDTEVNGIKIDKATRVISWSIIDSNNADATDEIGIEITVFDSNGNIIKKERNTDHQRSFTINNSSKITGDLYFTYKLYVTKQYLDTLSVMITTDKAPFGVPTGEYVGVYVSNNSRASINPSDYSWFQSSAGGDISTEINNKIARLSAEFDIKLENLKDEVDENFVTIYYKSVEWTQAEVDVYCQTGYEGIWSRDITGYTGEVKTGNVLYITVHNTGTSSSSTDDSYGQLEIRALADAAAGESVQGVVLSYLVSAEIALDALTRFKSSLLEDGDETLIYGGHIQTGTIDANRIVSNSITATEIASGTITSNNLNVTDINQSGTLQIGAFNSNTQQDILNSNIQVGGRNYALGTGESISAVGQNIDNQSIILYPLSLTVEELNAIPTGCLIMSFDMTISSRITGTSGTPSISVGQRSTPWNRIAVTETEPGTYHKEIVIPNRAWTTVETSARVNYIDTDCEITFFNFKMEVGNKYTDWTPAPEDIEADISSTLEKTQRIYYRSSSNTKPSGAALISTWVTESGNKWNTNATTSTGWSKKVTPIANEDNPTAQGYLKCLYLWAATQRQLADGTVVPLTADDIALDDSTTIIDGGQIITGTIDANQINAGAITIGKIATADQEQILNSNVQVGGRNLLLKTNSGISFWRFNLGTRYLQPTMEEVQWLGVNAMKAISNGLSTVTSPTTWTVLEYRDTDIKNKISAGQEYILSFDATSSLKGVLSLRDSNGSNSMMTSIKTTTEERIDEDGNVYYHHVYRSRANETLTISAQILYDVLNLSSFLDTSGNILKIANLKLELGNKATDWTPAPEDIDEQNMSTRTMVANQLQDKVSVGQSNINTISDIMSLKNDGLHIEQIDNTSGIQHIFGAHLTSNALAFEQDGNEIARAGADKFSAQELVVKSNVSGQMAESHLTIGKFRIGTHAVGLGTNLRIYYVGDE